MSIPADHEHVEPQVSAQLAADIADRLRELDTSDVGSAFALETPRDRLNRASELMCGENVRGALDTLLTGWPAVEREAAHEDPQRRRHGQITALEFAAALIDCAEQSKEDSLSAEWRSRRIALLEEMGRQHQAALERTLGATAFREPAPESYPEIERAASGFSEDDVEGMDIRVQWGVSLARQGRHAEAIQVLEGVRALSERLERPESRVLAQFLVEDSYVQLGDEETSLACIQEIIRTTDNRAVIAMVLMKRARLSIGTPSKTAATVYDLTHALELFTACGIRSGAVLAALSLASQLQETGALEAAVLAYEVAVDHAERSESHLLPSSLVALANAYNQSERFADADERLSRYLETLEPQDGSQDSERAAAYGALGHARIGLGDADGAGSAWASAFERYEGSEDAESAAATAANIAKLDYSSGQMAESLEWSEKAVALAQAGGVHPLQIAEHVAFRATVAAKVGDASALEAIDKALEVAAEFEAEFHAAQFLELRSVVLYDLGRPDDAIAATLLAGDAYGEAGLADEGARCDVRAADLLRHRERLVEAASVYRSAIDRHPDRPDCLYAAFHGLALSLEALGQEREASEAAADAEQWKKKAHSQGLSLE